MADLQAQVSRQTQELAFYRGIVAQGAGAIGVKVDQLHISQGTKPQKFVLHVALVRSVRPDNVAVGSLGVMLDGTAEEGKAVSIELSQVTPGKQHELPYNFRYFQNLDQEVALPAGFQPARVAIEVRSSKKDVAPATQTFPWAVDPS